MTRTFSHRDAGTSEAAWRAGGLDALPRLRPPAQGDRVVIVAAHPDDEALGAGGLIASASRPTVLFASDGEASHPRSPTHTANRLAAIRRAEATAAVRALGGEPVFLGLPDGRLAAHADALTAAIAQRLDGCTLLVTPWRGDRHPDHAACADAGAAALRPGVVQWQYPVWAWHWADPSAPSPAWERLHRLDLSSRARRAKAAAIGCYRSQSEPLSPADGDEPILGPETLAHFDRDFECFVVPAPAASADYFDRLYASDADPWGLAGRGYERRKREVLLAALPRERFRRAFEPGCATGLLTERLADRCDEVVAWDGAARPLTEAAERLDRRPGVRLEQRRIPDAWPGGAFDLVVLSEVGYYVLDLDRLARRVRCSLTRDGVVVACHWRRSAPDHPQRAEDVHLAVGAGLHRLVHHVEDDFVLDVWSADGRSVAQAGGIVP